MTAVLAALLARPLDVLMTGDDSSTALGVDPTRLRAILLVLTSLLTGAIVAVAGGISFVGLVIPHVARMIVGADHRRMLPVAVLGGAVFLVVADLLARTISAPRELPLGVLTAFVGAPFFLWLMRRRGASQAGADR